MIAPRADVSPASMATIKRQIYGGLSRPLDEALSDANGLMIESVSGSDFTEGVQSFIERRQPRFAPLDAGRPTPI